MKKIFLLGFIVLICIGLLAQTSERKKIYKIQEEACYLCENVPGGYVKFFLPNSSEKEQLAKENFKCEPFEIVYCPTTKSGKFQQYANARIIGTIKSTK